MKILVTGGAGYIGGFMTQLLLDKGHSVIVADSGERGHKERIDKRAALQEGNLLDKAFVKELFPQPFDGVIHFAGYISMAESMKDPYLYFENNVQASLNILDQMKCSGTKNIIFSSTAGVYGNPLHLPLDENHPKNPTNPYGESKLMVERILHWYNQIYGINFAALRYFNAAGAALDGSRGEAHDPETHIIPNIMKALREKTPFTLYGTDYNTPDGTCVRDYIHVIDLVEAHLLALEKLHTDPGGYTYNVGTGNGYSNKEVIHMVEEVTGEKVEVVLKDRRPGDAESLVADNRKVQEELGFAPQYSDLQTIIKSAWKWHNNEE